MQRFVEVAQKELPKGLIVQSPLIDKHLKEPITKVRDLNSFFVEPGDDFSHNYEKGLFVDIFPFIAYPTLSRKLVKKLTLGTKPIITVFVRLPNSFGSVQNTPPAAPLGLCYAP